MSSYGITFEHTFTSEVEYEIEADSQEEAIEIAREEALHNAVEAHALAIQTEVEFESSYERD